MSVYRIYVEKKPEYAVEAKGLLHEIQTLLGVQSVTGLRILNRYDVEGVTESVFLDSVNTVFSEPQLDLTHATIPEGDVVFATEFLPGQFDQRAASALNVFSWHPAVSAPQWRMRAFTCSAARRRRRK